MTSIIIGSDHGGYNLKQEIIARGKVPYYGTAESHAISRNVAIGSGFLPAWCEIQVRKQEP